MSKLSFENNIFLPIGINIKGRKILLIGGGKVAFHKAFLLKRFTEKAIIVSPNFDERFRFLPFLLKEKEYEPSDLEGAFLVYICTEKTDLNKKIKAECEKRGILASVCDNPDLCDFISPAIYKNENLTISVLSNSKDARQSIAVRDQIESAVDRAVIDINYKKND